MKSICKLSYPTIMSESAIASSSSMVFRYSFKHLKPSPSRMLSLFHRRPLVGFIIIGVLFPFWIQVSLAQTATMEEKLLEEPAVVLAADAREKGDPVKGAITFYSPGIGCIQCHDPNGTNALIGPDLAIWKRTVDDEHLVLSVLKPSEHIEPDYLGLLVLMDDGQMVRGVEKSRDEDQLVLRIGAGPEDVVRVPMDEIELEKPSTVSLMPAGQVNGLRDRQEFLNLIAYLIAIRDGGPEMAKDLRPSEEAMKLKIPEYESHIDHRGFIEDWSLESWERGRDIFASRCVNCHGTIEEAGSLPTSLRFAQGKFKSGSDPYSIYRTLTHGSGMMLPQPWMVPQQKYDVILYLREQFLKEHNPTQFTEITQEYLEQLPQGDSRGPQPNLVKLYEVMDYGSSLTTTIEFGDDGSNIAQKAIVIQLDDAPGGVANGSAWMVFEHDTLRMAGAWSGDFVNWNGIQFDGHHGVHLHATGKIAATNPTAPGWANPQDGSLEDEMRVIGRDDRRYGPLPNTWGKFLGMYRHGRQVILHYTVGETDLMERPCLLVPGKTPVYGRTLNVGSRRKDLQMVVVTTGDKNAEISYFDRYVLVSSKETSLALAAPGLGQPQDFALVNGRVVLKIPRGTEPLEGTVWFTRGAIDEQSEAEMQVALELLESDLMSLTQGGPAQRADPVEVTATKWFESETWRVDELVRPEKNPWNARTRVTGIDFFSDDNSMAMCTWDGDVWRVDGLQSMGKPNASLRWRRIATGLYQPLGILVEPHRLLVSCRDQIVSLHDLNGDGEMDQYRCFNSDHQVTEHFHEFAMGLQRDPSGNYYYAKSARHALKAVVPHHGTLLKVSPDGKTTEILATGFRAANGVCLNEDGSFIVTDQEGHWNPKNRINWVRPGGFYGNMFGYHDVTDSSDDAMEQPLCWITNAFDRSPAELLWVPKDCWGPLAGQLLNLSYGYGRIYVVPYEMIPRDDGFEQPQGGMCQLPLPDLPTGMIRGRFSPSDGQLYVGGMFSWAGSRQDQQGGLFRVSFQGKRADLPIDLHSFEHGVEVTFSDPIDTEAAKELDRYAIKVWGLHRTKEYGSPHVNERQLAVTAAEVLGDGRTLRLTIQDLQPTWGMEISCRLKTITGKEFRRVLHNTIHQLDTP